jgi:hypothetical protein
MGTLLAQNVLWLAETPVSQDMIARSCEFERLVRILARVPLACRDGRKVRLASPPTVLARALVLGLVLSIVPLIAIASSSDHDQIRQVVLRHRAAITRCAQGWDADARGKLVVRFVIEGSGRVRQAERDPTSTLAAPEVEACVLDEVRRWRFYKNQHGSDITVAYPFLFIGVSGTR